MKHNLIKSTGSLIATAETESATRALTSKTARATRTTKTAVATKTQQQMTPPRNCRSLKNSGFTIIEVALVLAIAGLIFLVVFLALPALQNSQKDTARKQDVGRVVSALQSYMADNQGSLDSLTTNGAEVSYSPGASSGFGAYVGKLSQTTDVAVYRIGLGLNTRSIAGIKARPVAWGADHVVWVSIGEACVSGSSGYGTSTSTDASIYALLSNGTFYCASM
jgi:prepilin-type N-terminal cleavage/methylation domain-containing protein